MLRSPHIFPISFNVWNFQWTIALYLEILYTLILMLYMFFCIRTKRQGMVFPNFICPILVPTLASGSCSVLPRMELHVVICCYGPSILWIDDDFCAFCDAFLHNTIIKSGHLNYSRLSVSWNQSDHSPLTSVMNILRVSTASYCRRSTVSEILREIILDCINVLTARYNFFLSLRKTLLGYT